MTSYGSNPDHAGSDANSGVGIRRAQVGSVEYSCKASQGTRNSEHHQAVGSRINPRHTGRFLIGANRDQVTTQYGTGQYELRDDHKDDGREQCRLNANAGQR